MAGAHGRKQGYSSQAEVVCSDGTVLNPAQTLAALCGTLEGATEMIAVEDTASHYLAFNRAYHDEFQKIFGVDLQIGDSMSEVLAHLPEEQRAAIALYERTIRGEAFTVTHEFGDTHRARRIYEIHCFPFYDNDGRVLGGSHIARDVTEQRRAEEALRASQENYARIIESSQDCIKVLDLEGHLLSINACGRRLMELDDLTGYLGHLWQDAWQEEDRRMALAALERARAGNVGRFRARGQTLKGNLKWWEVTVSPILDAEDRPERLLVMARDVTEQQQAEDELQRERTFLRQVIAAAPSMIFVKDWEGRFVLANDALAHAYGTSTDGVVGKTDADFNPHQEELDHFRHDDRQVMITRRELLIPEERVTFANGEVHWFSTIKVPLINADGSCDKLLGVAGDITARKRAEEALQRFRIALDSAADNIFLIDPEQMRYLDVSQSACHDLGYSREELLNLGPLEIMPDISKEDLEARFAEIRSDPAGKGSIETIHYRKDGTGFEVEVILRPVEIDGRPLLVAVARDITERKRTQEALRASEERLKLAQQAGHVGVFDWNIATDRAVITGELACIFGVPADTEGGYETWFRFVHPDDLPRIMDQFQQCLRERLNQADFEYRINRSDGQVRWIEVKGQIRYRDDNGVPERMIGTIADITDRKEAEIALRESEGKFRALAENARASFGIVQGQRFVYVNPWFAQISGYSIEELLTKDFPDLVHPDFQPMMIERARRRQQGESVPSHYDFAMLTKNGEKRWVEFSVATFEYRGGPAIVGTGFDITDRKRAEDALRLSNERLKLLSEAAAHLLKAENPETMIRELFEKVSTHLDVQGYMNFMVNEAGDALRLDSYAGVPQEAARMVQRLEYGQGVCGTVAQCRRPIYAVCIQQSENVMVQLLKGLGIRAYACNPLMAGGRLLGTLAFATTTRDAYSEDDLEFMRTISQYVAMAKERLRLEGELRQNIGQLAAANEALAEADRRKNEFLAMLAHELRNPLAPIRNAMQVLRMTDLKEPAHKRQGDIIDRQISHMARLLNDLLDVSRITRGKIELKRQPLELSTVMAHALETARPLVEARHHALYVTTPPPDLRVLADMDRLAQVVGNLVTNAAKYTEDGGRIWVEAAREEDEAVIRVRDTGVGIQPDLLPHIFELFTQADQSLARSQGGLGIGLTMVRSLVEMHGGSVEAWSEGLGRGSEFIVRLPALAAEAAPATNAPEPPHAEAGNMSACRVLVVDDVRDTAQSLSELLEIWGHRVCVAYDGTGALETARAFKPEIVLLDIGLPDMNGYDVARRLRQEEGGRRLMIVALTGYGQESAQHESSAAGFDYHLVKPVDLEILKRLLNHPAAA